MGELQNFSKKLIISSHYVKKDGTGGLYIYASIKRKFDPIPMKLDGPAKFSAKKAGQLVTRHKGDLGFIGYPLIISSELNKVNEICTSYRLS